MKKIKDFKDTRDLNKQLKETCIDCKATGLGSPAMVWQINDGGWMSPWMNKADTIKYVNKIIKDECY